MTQKRMYSRDLKKALRKKNLNKLVLELENHYTSQKSDYSYDNKLSLFMAEGLYMNGAWEAKENMENHTNIEIVNLTIKLRKENIFYSNNTDKTLEQLLIELKSKHTGQKIDYCENKNLSLTFAEALLIDGDFWSRATLEKHPNGNIKKLCNKIEDHTLDYMK